MDGWFEEWMVGCMDELVDKCFCGRMVWWMNGLLDVWSFGWVDGWMDRCFG